MSISNKFYVKIKKNIKYKPTFEELNDNYNHFEVAFLAMTHAKNTIFEGRNLIPEDSPFKPKVAVLALHEICSHPELIEEFKQEILNKDLKVEETDEYENSILDDSVEEDSSLFKEDNEQEQEEDLESID